MSEHTVIIKCSHPKIILLFPEKTGVRLSYGTVTDEPRAFRPRHLSPKSAVSWCVQCGALSLGKSGKWREPYMHIDGNIVTANAAEL